jgi:phosphinothricin acetyltransferase
MTIAMSLAAIIRIASAATGRGNIVKADLGDDTVDSERIRIRRATLADLPALVEIHNHYVTHTHITFDVEPFTVDERRSWFQDHNDGKRYRIVVAEIDGVVVGSASSGRHRAKAAYDTTVETSIACRPAATGRGIGTLLYQALFAELAAEDIHRLVAGVAQPNDASNALHRRLGFRELGRFTEVGRKFGQYWDVLWFERELH